MNTVSVERSSLGSSSLCVNTVYNKMKTKRSVVKILASIGSSFMCALQFCALSDEHGGNAAKEKESSVPNYLSRLQ